MKKTVIRFNLSEQSLEKAIKEVQTYKKSFLERVDLFKSKVAQRIGELAQSGFTGAVVDDLTDDSGGKRLADVSVSVDNRDNISVVIASGEDAIWVEFGAGVHHNGSAGTSPHPSGSELGLTIGGYGKGMGKRKVWGFYEDGVLRLTRGTPAIMPMYNAMKMTCEEISDIAKEVFK